MNKKKSFLKASEGVSAVIGVILMVTITVAIASTVYVYVSGDIKASSSVDVVVCGKIEYMTLTDSWDDYGFIKMVDDKTINLIYHVDNVDNELLKFAYAHNCTVSIVINTCSYPKDTKIIKSGSVSLLDCGDD